MNGSRKPLPPAGRRPVSPRAWRVAVCLAGGLLCAAHAEENAAWKNPPQTAVAPTAAIPRNLGEANAQGGAAQAALAESAVRTERMREAQIRELVSKTNAAIRRGDFAMAEVLLGALGHFLSERSLTMLRMRAWLAHSSGQDEAAREAYRQVLERIENDENAGINLAILAARAGQKEEAARILTDVALHHPDSPLLAAARQALGMVIDDPFFQDAVFQER